MNKLDVRPPALKVSSAPSPRPEPARRLIVLIPSLEANLTAIARRVWELANTTATQIQFFGLYSDPAQEPSLRRELITMSAMVNNGIVSAKAEAALGKDWVDEVRKRYQAGDMIVCLAEHRVGLSRKPLSQMLQSELNVPLYILSDLYPQNTSHTNWIPKIAAWAGSIAIILGCTLLQASMVPLAEDWAHTALLLISIPIEFWMILGWNSLFG